MASIPRSTSATSRIPILVQRLQEEHANIRWIAARVLGRIGPSAKQAVSEALTDENNFVRTEATEALERIRVQ